MTTHKIHTYYECAPIPQRQFDWSATLDGYDGSCDAAVGNHCGTGDTELNAIKDLLYKLESEGE